MLYGKGHRWQIQQPELYELLGLKPGQHLPVEGFRERTVTDTHGNQAQFFCLPANEPAPRDGSLKGCRKSSKHRIYMHCDACMKWIPFGRAWQHRKGKEHKVNFALMAGEP